jgi:hypothetical protein
MRLSHKLLVVLLSLGFAVTAFAQGAEDYAKPITKSGSAAFIFSVSGPGTFGLQGPSNIGVDSIANMDISTIYHVGVKSFLSDDLALRVMLDFGIENDGNPVDSLQTKGTVFGIGLGIQDYLAKLYSTGFYVGGSLGYEMAKITEPAPVDKAGSGKQNPQSQPEISASWFYVAGLAGFDWFPWNAVAIGAEYSLGYTAALSSKYKDQNGKETDADKPSTFGFTGGANVHLVVYF